MNTPPPSDKSAGSTKESAGDTEPQGNRETEQQRGRVSEKKRHKETETLTIQTKQKIPLLASRVATLPQAVKISLQDEHKENSIFIFCRAIKAFEITTGVKLSHKELEGAFALWWSMARPSLPDGADFDEYRFEFQRIFEKTRTPLGANSFHQAIEQADMCPTPAEAARYESPKIKRLVAVCFQLQLLTGNAPFFISARDAAAVLGTKKPETGLANLGGLVWDGILTIAQKGEPGGNRATRYRYNRQ